MVCYGQASLNKGILSNLPKECFVHILELSSVFSLPLPLHFLPPPPYLPLFYPSVTLLLPISRLHFPSPLSLLTPISHILSPSAHPSLFPAIFLPHATSIQIPLFNLISSSSSLPPNSGLLLSPLSPSPPPPHLSLYLSPPIPFTLSPSVISLFYPPSFPFPPIPFPSLFPTTFLSLYLLLPPPPSLLLSSPLILSFFIPLNSHLPLRLYLSPSPSSSFSPLFSPFLRLYNHPSFFSLLFSPSPLLPSRFLSLALPSPHPSLPSQAISSPSHFRSFLQDSICPLFPSSCLLYTSPSLLSTLIFFPLLSFPLLFRFPILYFSLPLLFFPPIFPAYSHSLPFFLPYPLPTQLLLSLTYLSFLPSSSPLSSFSTFY